MDLEKLKELKEINGYRITRGKPESMTWDDYDKTRKDFPIHISKDLNSISFALQKDCVEESVTGCTVETIIETAILIIDAKCKECYSYEYDVALGHLNSALDALEHKRENS